jgi:hypothetical protein
MASLHVLYDTTIFAFYTEWICAANFSFAQLATRKSLGRSKPATNSQAQAPQNTVWNILLYPSLTELPSIEIK